MIKNKKVRFLERSTPPHIFTLILLASISALTMNIFLPSLPTIAADLNSSTSILGLSVGIYLASSALLQLIIGPFSDQFGRRPLILCSLIIFCLSTFGHSFCHNCNSIFDFAGITGDISELHGFGTSDCERYHRQYRKSWL